MNNDKQLHTDTVERVSTAGMTFPDGTAVELIRDFRNSLKLLAWNGNAARISDQHSRGDVMYAPPPMHHSIRDSLVLPTGLAKFGSTRKLFGEIEALILRACGWNESVAKALTFMVFASWLAEFALVAPFVWLVAPKSTTAGLEQILRRLCRHALVVNALGTNWPSALPMVLQPTLISSIDKPSRRMLNVLRASQTHSVFPIRTGEAVDPFCAKLILAREPVEDPAAAGFPLEIVLAPEGKYGLPTDDTRATGVAEVFQNKLLAYRLANFSKIASPKVDLDRLSAPMQALAHGLAGAVIGESDLQRQILPYLQETDAELQSDTDTTLTAAIVEALIAHRNKDELPVAEITGYANTIIAGRGGSIQLTPEAVGWRLRSLGLHRVLNSHGRKILRVREVQHRILNIAATYGVAAPQAEVAHDEPRPARQRKD